MTRRLSPHRIDGGEVAKRDERLDDLALAVFTAVVGAAVVLAAVLVLCGVS